MVARLFEAFHEDFPRESEYLSPERTEEVPGQKHVDNDFLQARPIEEWHEDQGPVLWWKFPIEEPPYCGTPLDTDWPGYHTHWSLLPIPTL